MDAQGNAYVTGETDSGDAEAVSFPITEGAFQPSSLGSDAFVTKLRTDGSLVYSTYLGGNQPDRGRGITVDSSGNAYVTGVVRSDDFPTTGGAFQGAKAAAQDAFVIKLNASGSALVYSTFLGGDRGDEGHAIAVDPAGNAWVAGETGSRDDNAFPTTSNAVQTTYGGGLGDGFATKLNGDGSQVVFSTYLGGRFLDRSWGIAVDSAGNAYVTGEALSDEFPLKNPIKQVLGTRDAFVTKFDSDGALVYSTFYGGGGSEIARGIAVDDEGNAYIAGVTNSGNFPEVNSLPKGETEDFGNAFVAVINAAGDAAVFSSPLGGDKDDEANAIAVDDEGNIYLTGITRSVDFPVASFQENFGGGLGDAFVAKIGEVITPELKLFFAHFGNGQGLTSDTVLTNPSLTKTATGTVDYSDKDGNPLPVGLAAVGDGIVPLATASSVNFSIPPLGDLTIATDGQGPVISGAAVVTSDNPLGGVIRFSIPGIGIAGVGASQTLSAFIIPVRRKAGGINTGVAMHNTESTPVQVSLKLHQTPGQITPAGFDTFQDGEPVATTSIDDFPAGGHVAKFINELFPGTDTDNFGGTLVVEVTDGKVAATALELGTQPGEFTTLPVTALQD